MRERHAGRAGRRAGPRPRAAATGRSDIVCAAHTRLRRRAWHASEGRAAGQQPGRGGAADTQAARRAPALSATQLSGQGRHPQAPAPRDGRRLPQQLAPHAQGDIAKEARRHGGTGGGAGCCPRGSRVTGPRTPPAGGRRPARTPHPRRVLALAPGLAVLLPLFLRPHLRQLFHTPRPLHILATTREGATLPGKSHHCPVVRAPLSGTPSRYAHSPGNQPHSKRGDVLPIA
mmetsp:Transcript_18239/g.46332  ORF Transcript_18239/g.46332 Transcript_18239/m.46332 type:complete len:231 (-) Transcript_18239:759-1451(-)